jgi:hypothetical protein
MTDRPIPTAQNAGVETHRPSNAGASEGEVGGSAQTIDAAKDLLSLCATASQAGATASQAVPSVSTATSKGISTPPFVPTWPPQSHGAAVPLPFLAPAEVAAGPSNMYCACTAGAPPTCTAATDPSMPQVSVMPSQAGPSDPQQPAAGGERDGSSLIGINVMRDEAARGKINRAPPRPNPAAQLATMLHGQARTPVYMGADGTTYVAADGVTAATGGQQLLIAPHALSSSNLLPGTQILAHQPALPPGALPVGAMMLSMPGSAPPSATPPVAMSMAMQQPAGYSPYQLVNSNGHPLPQHVTLQPMHQVALPAQQLTLVRHPPHRPRPRVLP